MSNDCKISCMHGVCGSFGYCEGLKLELFNNLLLIFSVSCFFFIDHICVAWARLRLTNLEPSVHMGIKSVVLCFQPEQNNPQWFV